MNQHRIAKGFLTALPLVFAMNTAKAGDAPAPDTAAQKEVLALLQPAKVSAVKPANTETLKQVSEEVVVTGKLPQETLKQSFQFDVPLRKEGNFKQRIFEAVRDRLGVVNLELDNDALAYQFYKSQDGGRFQIFIGEQRKMDPPKGMERLFKDDHHDDKIYGLRYVHEF